MLLKIGKYKKKIEKNINLSDIAKFYNKSIDISFMFLLYIYIMYYECELIFQKIKNLNIFSNNTQSKSYKISKPFLHKKTLLHGVITKKKINNE